MRKRNIPLLIAEGITGNPMETIRDSKHKQSKKMHNIPASEVHFMGGIPFGIFSSSSALSDQSPLFPCERKAGFKAGLIAIKSSLQLHGTHLHPTSEVRGASLYTTTPTSYACVWCNNSCTSPSSILTLPNGLLGPPNLSIITNFRRYAYTTCIDPLMGHATTRYLHNT